MPAPAKFLLRLFLASACAFGFAVGVITALVLFSHFMLTGEGGLLSGLSIVATITLGGGSLFGRAMTVLLGGWHLLAVWRRGFRLTAETLAVSHRRQLTIALPFGETFTLCLASVRYLGKADVEEEETDYAT